MLPRPLSFEDKTRSNEGRPQVKTRSDFKIGHFSSLKSIENRLKLGNFGQNSVEFRPSLRWWYGIIDTND